MTRQCPGCAFPICLYCDKCTQCPFYGYTCGDVVSYSFKKNYKQHSQCSKTGSVFAIAYFKGESTMKKSNDFSGGIYSNAEEVKSPNNWILANE